MKLPDLRKFGQGKPMIIEEVTIFWLAGKSNSDNVLKVEFEEKEWS